MIFGDLAGGGGGSEYRFGIGGTNMYTIDMDIIDGYLNTGKCVKYYQFNQILMLIL